MDGEAEARVASIARVMAIERKPMLFNVAGGEAKKASIQCR